jgi:hypothetical protein
MWVCLADWEKILEHTLAITVLKHILQAAYTHIFHVWQIMAHICFCVYKQIHVGQGFEALFTVTVPNCELLLYCKN